MYIKDFEGWSKLKQELNDMHNPPFFNEREIWWCSIGMNIGYEVYGKGKLFTRPVLILKKQSVNTFVGVPMSTKLKQREDFYHIDFNGQRVAIMLGEIRKFDSRRLADKLGKLSEEKFRDIKLAICKIFSPA